MNWKTELKNILSKGCTDSDIEDFIIAKRKKVNAREVWDFVYEYNAPKQCIGCKNIQRRGMYPCNSCTRLVELKDYYEKR